MYTIPDYSEVQKPANQLNTTTDKWRNARGLLGQMVAGLVGVMTVTQAVWHDYSKVDIY